MKKIYMNRIEVVTKPHNYVEDFEKALIIGIETNSQEYTIELSEDQVQSILEALKEF